MLIQHQQIVTLLSMHQSNLYLQSEQRMALFKSAPNYYTHLKSVLVDNNKDHIKLVASVYINKFLEDKLEENQSAEIVFNYFCDLFKNQHIDNFYKRQVEKSLIKFIELYGSKLLNQFINLIKQLIQFNFCDPAYIIIAAFTVPDIDSSNFYYFIHNIFLFSLIPLIDRVNISNIINLNGWAKAISQILIKLIIKAENQHAANKIFNSICQQPSVAKIIYEIYLLEASQYTLLSFNPELDELNLLKYEISQIHVKIITQMFQEKLQLKQHNKVLDDCLPFFYNTLVKVASAPELLDLNHTSEFITIIMKIIKKLIKSGQFYNKISELAINLLKLVIFPFLATTQEENNSFHEQPIQFIALAQDASDRQEFQIIKTEAASLLQALTDYIDGMLTFVVNSVISTLSQYIGLKQYLVPPLKIKMDECWMILTILSCSLAKRQDLMFYIRKILEYPILQKLNNIDLCRFFLFLSFNYDEIFKNNPQLGNIYLKAAYNYKGQQATMIQAIDFIGNVAEYYYSDQLFISIADKIQTSEVMILWDTFLYYISKKYKLISQKNMVYLVDKLLQRINIQFNKIHNKQKNTSTIIIKSLQIIKGISLNHVYLADKPFLVSKIWFIIKIFLTPQILQKIDYEDEIITILDDYIYRLQRFTENLCDEVLPSLHYILQASSNVLIYLFHTLNLIIIKSNFTIQNPYLIKILQILVSGLQPNLKKSQQQEIQIGRALLLLQLFLGKFIQILSQNIVIQTFNYLYKILNKLKNPRTIVRMFNTLLIMYPYLPNNIKYENNSEILAMIYKKTNIFYDYEIKVAIIALSKILFSETDLTLLCQTIKIIVEILNNLCKQLRQNDKSKQVNEKSKKQSKIKKPNFDKLKKKIQQNVKPFKASVKQLQSDWKKLDPFQYFKNQLQIMRQNNQKAYYILINGIPAQTLSNLKQLVSLTQVTTSIRKIYKITDIKCPNSEKIAEDNYQQKNGDILEQKQIVQCKRDRIKEKAKNKQK